MIDLSDTPPMRWWYLDDKNGRLIQLQRDVFFHNWRKLSPEHPYPHYQQTREMFEAAWRRFLDFLKKEELGLPNVFQCQIDYINHIEKGQGWDSLDDLPRITPLAGRMRSDFLGTPDVVVMNTRHVIPPEKGRLHMTLQPAIRNSDQTELLQLQLTARGHPASNETADILSWLDLGHEWVVRGFADLTTPEMHKIWGRTQ